MRAYGLTCMALVVLAVTACTSDSGKDPASSGTVEDRQAALTYGYGPSTDGSATYQPDVILVGGGPGAIRSASANGLVWTMDRAAPGVEDLAVGRIMFATSRAVGRVVDAHDEGDTRIVTLAPVDFTEVVRDAEITLDQPLDLAMMSLQHVPDLPGAIWNPDEATVPRKAARRSGPGALGQRPGRPRAEGQPAGDQSGRLPPAVERGRSIEIPMGDWKVRLSKDTGKVGLAMTRASGGLKAVIDLALTGSDMKIKSDLVVKNGQTTKSDLLITGVTGLHVDLSAGVPGGTAGNEKVVLEVPAEASATVPPSPATAGLPLNLKLVFKVSLTTALSGKNSTMLATGKYRLAGPIGISDGTLLGPTLEVEESIMDSLRGITLGPSGIVVGMKVEVNLGIGTPAAQVGPYGSLITSVGLTQGSVLGAPLVQCRRGTLVLTVGGGVGVEMSTGVTRALAALLPAKTKVELKTGIRHEVLRREQTIPESGACR